MTQLSAPCAGDYEVVRVNDNANIQMANLLLEYNFGLDVLLTPIHFLKKPTSLSCSILEGHCSNLDRVIFYLDMIFVVFLSLPRPILEQYLEINLDYLLQNPNVLIIMVDYSSNFF
jgi:hypothetical protein